MIYIGGGTLNCQLNFRRFLNSKVNISTHFSTTINVCKFQASAISLIYKTNPRLNSDGLIIYEKFMTITVIKFVAHEMLFRLAFLSKVSDAYLLKHHEQSPQTSERMASFQNFQYKIATTVSILTITLGVIYPLYFGCSGKYTCFSMCNV